MGGLRLIAANDGSEAAVIIDQDARIYAGILEAGQTAVHTLDENRYAWLQVARGTIRLNQAELKQGDGAAVRRESELTIAAHDQAEILLFDFA